MKYIPFLFLFFVACTGVTGASPVDTDATTIPATLAYPATVLVTVIVTATPEPVVQASPTVDPVILPPATVEAPATPEPLPVPTPMIVEIIVPVTVVVEIPVTVVVTATPTPTPTATPTPTPVPTETPVPTATPIPPFIQHVAGNGSLITDSFNFWDERPIEIEIAVIGSGSFQLNAVTPNGCVLKISSGVAPYTALAIAEPSAPVQCDGLNEFGNGTKLTVIAGGDVSWVIDLTQYSQPQAQNAPVSLTSTGQHIFGPVRLGQGELLEITSDGSSRFEVDVYSIFEPEPIVKRVIDLPTSVHGIWIVDVPIGVYMFAIDTSPDREWTATVRYQ